MKIVANRYRTDLTALERKYLILGFIPYYTYSKWIHGLGDITWWKFFRPTNWKNAEYFEK